MAQPPQQQVLPGVKNIIMVLSGKGGVGKSTVACQLAMSLAHREPNCKVGILDVDICGPSVPKICGVEQKSVTQSPQGLVPVELFDEAAVAAGKSLKVMSIAFLLPNSTDAVVWRGPRKVMMINQFVTGVAWGDLDYLIIDTPPGTSDEHMALCQALKALEPAGAVVVTTPQKVSTDDVRKELSFCHKLSLRCLGIVENMAGFVCPHCADCTDIFSRGGGEDLAKMYEVPFLGRIPIDPALSLAQDKGAAVAATTEEGALMPSAAAIAEVVASVKAQVARVAALKEAAAAGEKVVSED